jgi:hypothetical protein
MKNMLKGSAALLLLICNQALAEDEAESHEHAVKVVAEQRLALGNAGMLPLYVTSDWSKTQPSVTRAVVVQHGRLRNAMSIMARRWRHRLRPAISAKRPS